MTAVLDPRRWRGGSDGFFTFLDDVRPMVPSSKGGYVVYVPGDRERDELRKALDGDFRTVVLCWPRRHGKTLAVALIILWRFLSRRTQNVAMVANSEKQTTDTAYRTLRTIIDQTPALAAMVRAGAITVGFDRIEYPALGNLVQGFAASPSSLYGKKLSIAQIGELHAASSDAPYQVLASSTIDSDDGLVLVDSTVGARSSPLFALYQIATRGDDPTLYFSHISYRDLEDACANPPPWITARALRSRAAQMLPAEFAQQHLNLWTESSTALFPPPVMTKVRDGSYRLDVNSIAGTGAKIVGAGLDRAYGFSTHGDATITTAVVKTLIGEDEHLFVLASDKIAFSAAGGIRKHLTDYYRRFGMSRAAIESYNSQDIAAWCADQPFNHELIHPTADRQANAFTALYQAAAEGRLHIHPSFNRLLSEMETFEYRLGGPNTSGGAAVPRFEGAHGCHDDTVYSLAWAVYALRDVELNPYEIDGIHCHGPAPAVPMCVLNDGDMIPPCASSCRSMLKVRDLYKNYRDRGPISPVSFDDFVTAKLRNIGSHTIPR